MTKMPDVDWTAHVDEDGIVWEPHWKNEADKIAHINAGKPIRRVRRHPTSALEDNMRQVRMQFHGCHANAVDEANPTDARLVEIASRLSLGAQAPGVVGDPGTGNPHSTLGVGESIFSPSQINDYQRQAMALIAEERMLVEEANRRYLEGDTEFSDSDVEDYYLGKAPT